MQATGTYGKRGRLRTIETGVRPVAPTYGRARIRTSSAKAGDTVVDSQTERMVSHMLAVDPSVKSYAPQPFTVDLVARRLLTDPAQRLAAKREYSQRTGPCLYTPDFLIAWSGHKRTALEVKTEAFTGDSSYRRKLTMAGDVLSRYGYELATFTLPASRFGLLKTNLQLLQQAQRATAFSLSSEQLALLHQLDKDNLTLGDICAHLSLPLCEAPRLLLCGAIGMDVIAHPMRADTPVHLAYGDIEHLCIMQGVLS